MKIALFDSGVTLDGAQRCLLDVANGCLARQWEVVVVCGGDGPLRQACARRALPVVVLPVPAGRAAWRVVPRLLALIHREGIHRLYANSPTAALLGGLAMRLAGGRACWRLYESSEFAGRRAQTRLAARCCVQIHAPASAAPSLQSMIGAHAGLQALPPVIDLGQFPSHAPPALKRSERPVIGMIARWQPRSGHEVLLKAFRLLHDSGIAARLRLACPGAVSMEEERYSAMIRGAAQAAGLAARVIIEGEIHDIPGFLARCHVVVAPMLQACSGRSALEAAAAGRPIVASRVAGFDAIIEDGHTGLLVPANQPHALADALALLLASPALRAEIGRQARQRAASLYGLEGEMSALDSHFLNQPRLAG